MMGRGTLLLTAALMAAMGVYASAKADSPIEAGKQAFEAGEYRKAEQILKAEAEKQPKNAAIQFWLTRTYYEMNNFDEAVDAGERAVELEPNNSKYHEWLGRAYGEKADRASWFSGLSLARKTHKEFERAVELDEHNLSAQQALVEFDCAAPGIAGGGEDKARPHIARLAELDAAEGHYAEGNCRRQKKDYAEADAEFTKALESHPKSADLIYDIGDYAMKRGQAGQLDDVVKEGEKAAPEDPRGEFYRAVALILRKERPSEAESLLKRYLKTAPIRSNYPSPSRVHEWMGHLYKNEGNAERAEQEYRAALQLDSKNKTAREALKKLGQN